MDDTQRKEVTERLLKSEPSISAAFTSRKYDGIFAVVGREVATRPLDHTQEVWLGWEWLTDSHYLDI